MKEEGDDIEESAVPGTEKATGATTIATHTVVASYSECPNDDKQLVVELGWSLTKLMETIKEM